MATTRTPVMPHHIVDACARAWLSLLSEARSNYHWHTSDVRTAKPTAMGLALCRDILRRGEESLRPLKLDAVLDEFEAEERARNGNA